MPAGARTGLIDRLRKILSRCRTSESLRPCLLSVMCMTEVRPIGGPMSEEVMHKEGMLHSRASGTNWSAASVRRNRPSRLLDRNARRRSCPPRTRPRVRRSGRLIGTKERACASLTLRQPGVSSLGRLSVPRPNCGLALRLFRAACSGQGAGEQPSCGLMRAPFFLKPPLEIF